MYNFHKIIYNTNVTNNDRIPVQYKFQFKTNKRLNNLYHLRQIESNLGQKQTLVRELKKQLKKKISVKTLSRNVDFNLV